MSGVKHNKGKPMMDLIDYDHVVKMAETLTKAYLTGKYSKFNWRNGIPVSELFAATMRHLAEFSQRRDIDPESGLLHIHHAATDLMMLYCMLRDRPDLDDRYDKDNKIS